MSGLSSLDLKTVITTSMTDVFDTMLSKVITPNGDAAQFSDDQGIVGSVGFAGQVMGNVSIHVTHAFAQMITASMLGISVDEIEGDEEVHDVIGELCNMVGGDLKSRLCDAGMPCELSIPFITSGSNFKIEPKGWVRNEKFGFHCEAHTAIVEIYMKKSD